MIYKHRKEPNELCILKSLNTRMSLDEKDKQYYFNLKKGYEGEVLLDSLLEKLSCECIILNDLLLKQNNTLFQIDSLLITRDSLYLYEVKNYEGDYYYDSDRLYKKNQKEISNPLIQLNRTESLLRQLLKHLGYPTPIFASVVFINPEFTLYQSPLNKPFIFPTQINRHLKELNTVSSKLKDDHKRLADKLLSLHVTDSPYRKLPSYEYKELRKGVVCGECLSFTISVEGMQFSCLICGHREEIEAAVMRNVRTFKLLFPDNKLTANVIHEWCNEVVTKRRITRILQKNFKVKGVHQWTYYEE
ncbi:nuclease-related domain-containing protein [Bacillus sp. AFS040349]|uniref:nuclease-related domain-containing protein n=1 Tax=Bacillus sp. AFS040349 TaxID=2033502 RepID=UPI000BFD7E92|nr:nuclease-related domain-containing protein [Bacillus sp. AFS040349]PGT91104.1 nuclease [Bacillus sp. AFS040349]